MIATVTKLYIPFVERMSWRRLLSLFYQTFFVNTANNHQKKNFRLKSIGQFLDRIFETQIRVNFEERREVFAYHETVVSLRPFENKIIILNFMVCDAFLKYI